MSSCYCMGPQNGEPLCPCMMRNVEIVDGRYVKTQDLGPVSGSDIIGPKIPAGYAIQYDWPSFGDKK